MGGGRSLHTRRGGCFLYCSLKGSHLTALGLDTLCVEVSFPMSQSSASEIDIGSNKAKAEPV